MRFILAAPVFLGAILTASLPAFAQLSEITVQGQLTAIAPQALGVRNAMGQQFVASTDPNRVEGQVRYNGIPPANIDITGNASVESLNKGLIVRFAVELEKGKAISDVSEIVILGLEYDPTQQYGLLPDGLPDAPPEEGAKAPPKKSKVVDGKFLAIGQITKISKLGITVSFPDRGSVNAKIAEGCTVTIQSKDMRIAKTGDNIQVEGYLSAPGKIFAVKVTITHVEKEEPKRPAPMQPVATKKPRQPMGAEGFGVGDPREEEKPMPAAGPAAGPGAAEEGPARPKTKGKILKVS